MLCDKIAIIKDGRIQIACRVNQLLHVVGGYVIKIYLKRASAKKKKVFQKKRKFQSFNKGKSDFLFSMEKRDADQDEEVRTRGNHRSMFQGKRLSQEKSFEDALNLFSQLKGSKTGGGVKPHLIIMNRGKHLINTEDLIQLIGSM